MDSKLKLNFASLASVRVGLGVPLFNKVISFLKILIVFLPIYLTVYFTQNMVYVLPSLLIGIIPVIVVMMNLKLIMMKVTMANLDNGASDSSTNNNLRSLQFFLRKKFNYIL